MDSQTHNPELISSAQRAAAEQILHEYETLLANSAPPLGCVADISELPYSKQRLKEAVAGELASSTGARQDQLRMAYLSLADWQEGVGDQRLQLTLLRPRVRHDKQQPTPAYSGDMDRWNIRVVDERQALARELAAMGFGRL